MCAVYKVLTSCYLFWISLCVGAFQVTAAGVSGVTGLNVASRVVGVFGAGGESVTVPAQMGRGITVRGWELKS